MVIGIKYETRGHYVLGTTSKLIVDSEFFVGFSFKIVKELQSVLF